MTMFPASVETGGDRSVITDIEDIYQLVALESLSVPTEYVPPGKKHDAKRQEQETKVVAFKAERYREWIKQKSKKYQAAHPYLHFQLARVCGLKDDAAVVRCMQNIRDGLNQVSVADRAAYAHQAAEEVRMNATLRMTKLPNFYHPGTFSHYER